MPALIRPKTAVTVSIIANIPLRPVSDRTTAALHSQKNSIAEMKIETD
jgi:hypothetical protein